MKRRPRIYYTESQKKLMWDHWRKGDSLQQIAQLFERNHSSIQRILAETGGIRPAVRRRSRLALTLAEREEISRAVVADNSIRSIATLLGRAASTISRECWRRRQIDLWCQNPLTQPTTHKTRVSAAFDGSAGVRQNRPPRSKSSRRLQPRPTTPCRASGGLGPCRATVLPRRSWLSSA